MNILILAMIAQAQIVDIDPQAFSNWMLIKYPECGATQVETTLNRYIDNDS